jgi:mRNA-degrading endonuclease YafQ of YafQ-DinJ toxin-antitoxin module
MLKDIPEISVITNQFLFSPKQLQIQQTITAANPSYHSLMQCLQLNNEQIEVILQDHQLQDDWHSDRMLPQLKLLSCHESQK